MSTSIDTLAKSCEQLDQKELDRRFGKLTARLHEANGGFRDMPLDSDIAIEALRLAVEWPRAGSPAQAGSTITNIQDLASRSGSPVAAEITKAFKEPLLPIPANLEYFHTAACGMGDDSKSLLQALMQPSYQVPIIEQNTDSVDIPQLRPINDNIFRLEPKEIPQAAFTPETRKKPSLQQFLARTARSLYNLAPHRHAPKSSNIVTNPS